MKTITLTFEQPLHVEQVEEIASGAHLALSDEHWRAIEHSHQFLLAQLQQRSRIYGITTGFGPLADTFLSPENSMQAQQNLIYHLSSGVGELLSVAQTRAIMTARISTLARGYSGVSVRCIKLLIDCLNHGVTPAVPAMGTVGASGDLTPLAHIALALMGEGQVIYNDKLRPSIEVLHELSLTPLTPNGKDGLGLVNGTAAMTGIAALNQQQATRLLDYSAQLTVLYGELLNAELEALQPQLAQVRPHAGQQWAQQRLLDLSLDSGWLKPYHQQPDRLSDAVNANQAAFAQRLPQSAYTFRCAPQHLGAVADSLAFHQQSVTTELNSVTDNPVFVSGYFGETPAVVHGGNFFGQHIAFAADALNNALLTLAIHSERRIARLTDVTQSNGLPPFCRGNNNGLHSGFMGAQVTATALVAELRTHAMPASIQSVPTNANNQDVVTLGTIAARRCQQTVQLTAKILAIEAMIGAQAMDIHPNRASTSATNHGQINYARSSQQLYQSIRKLTEQLADDRPLSADIERVAKWLLTNTQS